MSDESPLENSHAWRPYFSCAKVFSPVPSPLVTNGHSSVTPNRALSQVSSQAKSIIASVVPKNIAMDSNPHNDNAMPAPSGSSRKRERENETPSQRHKRVMAAERQRRKRERDRNNNQNASVGKANGTSTAMFSLPNQQQHPQPPPPPPEG